MLVTYSANNNYNDNNIIKYYYNPKDKKFNIYKHKNGNQTKIYIDENDKIFVSTYNEFSNNGNYNLTSLTYKAEWLETTVYNKADFVYLDALFDTNLESEEAVLSPLNKNKNYFVCIADGVLNKNPLKNTDVWKQDKCSKTLQGCKLRFGNNTTRAFTDGLTYLPFGAFPATFPYNNETTKSNM